MIIIAESLAQSLVLLELKASDRPLHGYEIVSRITDKGLIHLTNTQTIYRAVKRITELRKVVIPTVNGVRTEYALPKGDIEIIWSNALTAPVAALYNDLDVLQALMRRAQERPDSPYRELEVELIRGYICG